MSKTIFDRDQHSVTTFEESADNFTLTRFQDADPDNKCFRTHNSVV